VSEPFEGIDSSSTPRAPGVGALASGLSQLVRAATEPNGTAEGMLRQLCTAAVGAIPADGAAVAIVEGGRLRAVHAHPRALTGMERLQDTLHEGPRHEAVARRAAVWVDVAVDAGRWPGLAEAYRLAGWRSALAMPLLVRDRARGVLTLYRSSPRPWTHHDLLVASSLTDVAASYLMLSGEQGEGWTAARDAGHRAALGEVPGLLGADALADRLQHALLAARRRLSSVLVLLVDVDDYLTVSDLLGPAACDVVLSELAGRLRRAVRSDDTVGHLTGGGFLVICEGLTGAPVRLDRQVRALAARIGRQLRESTDGGGLQATVPVSMGAAVGDDPQQAQHLVGDATWALAAARREGGGRLVLRGADVVSLADYRSARRPRAGW